jgi:hypothetical protein
MECSCVLISFKSLNLYFCDFYLLFVYFLVLSFFTFSFFFWFGGLNSMFFEMLSLENLFEGSSIL